MLTIIPDEVRKCVAFIACKTSQGVKLAGTAFFVASELSDTGKIFVNTITARHVIQAVEEHSIDQKVYLRMNFRDAEARLIATELSDWKFHPTDSSVDVATMTLRLPNTMDHLAYPTASFATPQVIAEMDIEIGQEVFLIGLFHRHFGTKRNIPIIRVGNIAAMPEEPVFDEKFGMMDAYLVEARSIGGLSGSPVFVRLEVMREIDGQLRFVRQRGGVYFLLGLMHGHWDIPAAETDSMVQDVNQQGVNMGIAVVVPATQILEVLNQPYYLALRKIAEEEARRLSSPTVDDLTK